MGKIISVSGLDGSGKSTLIRQIQAFYMSDGKNVRVLRSRPLGFPILSSLKHGKKGAEYRAGKERHFNKKPNGYFGSYLKFFYYYSDYLLGSVWLYKQKRNPNSVIIFDRYYFDYICDQQRFSLSVNKTMIYNLMKFIFIPDINIFLDAKKDQIYANRIEQSAEQIKISSNFFLDFFSQAKQGTQKRFYIIPGLEKDTFEKALNCIDEVKY